MASSGNKGGPTPGPPRPEQVEGAFFRGGSSLFRAVNFELYAKGSRSVAILGSMLLLVSVGIIANIDPKPNKPSGARKRDDWGRSWGAPGVSCVTSRGSGHEPKVYDDVYGRVKQQQVEYKMYL
eukprot:CAMPEP_0197508442 /NCGR_PEP_ID=MMETSP1312-20131121/29624_1 /TAXON_ID=464262 /ORGANISM="Genus nov. species nov., Strain RCC2335" /LENGTH=123 /DNA_ID=CAMNT_0043056197 /DNA_START=27 /DNA_END=399 /DNA_ORIENTATION=+